MTKKTFATETVCEAYLALLKERGVDHLYINGGTDLASVVEAYARTKESKLEFPEPIIASHENLGVGMAHGAYLISGRPQAIMVHVSPGTANTVMALMAASRDRIPLLLTAGRTPIYESGHLGSRNGGIHWGQEMYDQAGMVREFVKWDYELRGPDQLEAVVDRALTIAFTEPMGPVYLSLPREVLAEPLKDFSFREEGFAVPSDPWPAPAAIAELADLLLGAEFPVIVVQSAGREKGVFDLLNRISQTYSIGVIENAIARFVSASSDNPMHLGYAGASVFELADVLCYIDCDVPWMPAHGSPRDETTIVQAGPDPIFGRYPIRSHRSDLTITGTSRAILESLEAELARRAEPNTKRFKRIEEVGTKARETRQTGLTTARDKTTGPIDRPFINWCLNQILDEDVIIVNEYWATSNAVSPTQPGTMFQYPPAGALGWGLPAAVGVQQESPDKTVIATLGDGAYIFGNPAACHLAMATYDLPVLTIIYNNSKWSAVENSALGVYPKGHFANTGESSPLALLGPVIDYEKYSEAAGGYGVQVSERSELLAEMRKALEVVRHEHRQALVNVIGA